MISPEVDPAAVQSVVLETWTRLKQERVWKEEIWEECWMAYNSKFRKGKAEMSQFKSRRYLPWSFKAVENGTAQLVQGLMPNDEWFNVLGRTPDDEAAANVMTPLLRWQHYRTQFRSKATLLLKQARIFGNAPWGMNWKQDYIYKPDLGQHADNIAAYHVQKQAGENPTPPQVPMQMHRNYDGPCLEVGNIFNYVQERHNLDIGYPLRILRTITSKAALQAEAIPSPVTGWQKFDNLDQLSNQNTQTERSDALIRSMDLELGITDIPVDGVELLTAYGDIPLKDGTVLQNYIAVVANKNTLIRCEPNPYAHGKCPWNLLVLNPDPLELYGKGDLESALGLQDLANVTANQVTEAIHRIINPEFTAVLDGVFDEDDFVSIPGAVHPVAAQGNLQVLHKPDNTNIGFNQLSFLNQEFNEAANAMRQFSMPGDKISATEVQKQAQYGDARSGQLAQHVQDTFIAPCLQMEIDLNQQFMDEDTWIRVVNPSNEPAIDPMSGQRLPYPKFESLMPAPMKISPNDIQGDLDIYPVGAQWSNNRQQDIQQMVQAGQMMGQIPPAAAIIDWQEYGRELFRKMDIQDTWRFIKSPQRVAYEQQQQAMAQAANQSQQGGSGGPGPGQGGSPGPGGAPGNGGPPSMAGVPGPPAPPSNPGGQPSMGGPQTT